MMAPNQRSVKINVVSLCVLHRLNACHTSDIIGDEARLSTSETEDDIVACLI